MTTTIKQIVTGYLMDNGYDGLCVKGECACLLDNLMPCDEPSVGRCVPAYKRPVVPGSDECGFYVGPNKEEGVGA